MMLDWKAYRSELAKRIGEIGHLSPDTVRGYRGLSQAGDKANVLGAKTRDLIAIAVGVTRQCDGCIAVHTETAIKTDATRDEIAEALGVAIAANANAGAVLGYSARVMDALPTTDVV